MYVFFPISLNGSVKPWILFKVNFMGYYIVNINIFNDIYLLLYEFWFAFQNWDAIIPTIIQYSFAKTFMYG